MLFARIEEVQDEYQAKGWLPLRLNLNKGVVRGLIEIFAWGLYQLYQFLAAIWVEGIPKQASGEWLDLHADQVEQPRKQATKATGKLRFIRQTTQGNTLIPAGRIVRTMPDGTGATYRYISLADTVIAEGQTEVSVAVVAEEYGAAANLTAGQALELITPVKGIAAVEVRADWLDTEGADTEPDRLVQARYPLAWQGNNGSSYHVYKRAALGVTGVVACTVLDQHPRGQGTVDAIIKGAAGIPTADLLEKVRAAIDAEVFVNDDLLVKAPQAIAAAIAGTLFLLPGTVVETALAEAEKRIRALFTDPTTVSGISPLQIGEDLALDRLTAAVMAVPGVKRVEWTSPAADVVVPDDGLAILQSLALIHVEEAA
jgi:uncharacterized phage protein gp47/JayE